MRYGTLWLVLILVLFFAGVLPLDATDASELQPANILLVWQEGGTVCAKCDADAEGRGLTLADAIWDMERTADGKLFLDTAEHIVISERAQHLLSQVADSEKLRPAASVWLLRGEIPDAKRAASFLQNRIGTAKLGRVRAGLLGASMPTLPHLMEYDGRLVAVGA